MASVLFLAAALLYLAQAGLLCCIWLTQKKSDLKKIFSTLALVYVINFVLNIFWFFSISSPVGREIMLFDSMFLVLQSTLLVIALGYLSKQRHLLFLLFVYLFAAASVYVSFADFFLVVQFISYLILLLGFLSVAEEGPLGKVSLFGSLYSSMSLVVVLVLQFTKLNIVFVQPLVQLLLVIAFYHFYAYIRYVPEKRPKKECLIVSLVYQIFSLIIILVISGVAVVAIHELGHALAAKYFGCEVTKAVLYDAKTFPHTELVCSDPSNNLVIVLAGLFLPTLVGILLLWFGEPFLEDLSYLIIGFSFYFSNRDILDLGLSQNFIIVLMVISFLFLFIGVRGIILYFFREK